MKTDHSTSPQVTTSGSPGWNLYHISESRGVLFGIATLWIALFHSSRLDFHSLVPSGQVGEILYWILHRFQRSGNMGVDIFLFLSGMGLYFSLSKGTDLRTFYTRRYQKILIPTLIVGIFYFAITGTNGLGRYFQNIFLITFFTEGKRAFWYVALSFFLYLLYPLIHRLIEKYDWKAPALLILLVIGINYLLMCTYPVFYDTLEVALTRIPVFLIGTAVAPHIQKKEEIPRFFLFIWLIVFVLCFRLLGEIDIKHFLYVKRYLNCFYALSVIFCVSAFFTRFSLSGLRRTLIWIGGYSLEIYLLYEKLGKLCKNIFPVTSNSNLTYYIPVLTLSFILAIALQNLCKVITAGK